MDYTNFGVLDNTCDGGNGTADVLWGSCASTLNVP